MTESCFIPRVYLVRRDGASPPDALSNLYRRAQAEGFVTAGYTALLEKPSAQRHEARWLEVHEAALLLEAAKSYRAKRGDLAVPYARALLATFLLTGGRQKEVLGLELRT